ncbi:DUF4004 family protein [Desulfosporosinus sp. PR]|uniref:DUF4004 family protein n=1 Tax=Candidatus Desulfosporosinus nitrosoreducens TaxID=3401928 RepID=UPI0027F95F0C|nr:DUF4004 family protein [Desulfosporosinus sp. PR]MDQ7092015.1 DUF4004 family protein [Desulfosporosinus sp. PR]
MKEELLSKKELLILTGISYGQLYRWKRQNLIPEAWFIKQASFTGQETFFPKEKILKRVEMILNLKDQYSLEELADLLSPESATKTFTSSELLKLSRLNKGAVELFGRVLGKNQFAFRELLLMDIVGDLCSKYLLSEQELEDIVRSIAKWLPNLKNTLYRFTLCQREEQKFCLLLQQEAALYLDHRTEELQVYDLDELAKDLHLELNKALEEG